MGDEDKKGVAISILTDVGAFVREAKDIIVQAVDAAEEQAKLLFSEAIAGLGATKKEIVRQILEAAFGSDRVAKAWPVISVLIDAIVWFRKRRK